MARVSLIPLALFAALFVSGPAGAGGGGGDKKKDAAGPTNRVQAGFTLEGDHEEEALIVPGEAGPRAVDLPTIGAPMYTDGWLDGYVFMAIRLKVADGNDPWKVREQIHHLTDAIVRQVHNEPISPSFAEFDGDRARILIGEGVAEVLGEGAVDSIEFLSLDPLG